MRVLRVLALLGAILPTWGSAAASAAQQGVFALDEAVRTGRLAPVWETWFGIDRAERLAWARGVVAQGGAITAIAPLVQDLWLGTGAGQAPSASEQQEAVLFFFYGYLRLRIDGQYCRDASSPGDLLYFFLMDVRPVVDFVATLPPVTVRALAVQAAALERGSAGTRGPDKYICSRGRLTVGANPFLANDVAGSLADATRDIAIGELEGFGGRQPTR